MKTLLELTLPLRDADGEAISYNALGLEVYDDRVIVTTPGTDKVIGRISLDDFEEAVNLLWVFLRAQH